MSETRARRKIREAVEARGWSIDVMRWEPIGAAAEMAGPSGGWYLEVRAASGGVDWVLGYSWQECLRWIDEFLPQDKTSPLGWNP